MADEPEPPETTSIREAFEYGIAYAISRVLWAVFGVYATLAVLKHLF